MAPCFRNCSNVFNWCFIFKSNEDSSEKKYQTKFVKQTQPRKSYTVEKEKENSNEIIEGNKGADYISGIKDNVIAWTKMFLYLKIKLLIFQRQIKSLLLSIK